MIGFFFYRIMLIMKFIWVYLNANVVLEFLYVSILKVICGYLVNELLGVSYFCYRNCG